MNARIAATPSAMLKDLLNSTRPWLNWRMRWRWRRPAAIVRAIPITTSAAPHQTEIPIAGAELAGVDLKACENTPKRATTNPKPISASPVLIQARKVRSAARYTRGSFESISAFAGLTPLIGILTSRIFHRETASPGSQYSLGLP